MAKKICNGFQERAIPLSREKYNATQFTLRQCAQDALRQMAASTSEAVFAAALEALGGEERAIARIEDGVMTSSFWLRATVTIGGKKIDATAPETLGSSYGHLYWSEESAREAAAAAERIARALAELGNREGGNLTTLEVRVFPEKAR